MVAVVRDRVILVCSVLLAHSGEENVVDFISRELADRFCLNITLNFNGSFESEGTVTLRSVEINARLTRYAFTAIRKLVLADLDGGVVHDKSERTHNRAEFAGIEGLVHIDVQGAFASFRHANFIINSITIIYTKLIAQRYFIYNN